MASSPVLSYSLPEQEGYVKALLPWSWGCWVLGAAGLKAVAARAAWQQMVSKVCGMCRAITMPHVALGFLTR